MRICCRKAAGHPRLLRARSYFDVDVRYTVAEAVSQSNAAKSSPRAGDHLSARGAARRSSTKNIFVMPAASSAPESPARRLLFASVALAHSLSHGKRTSHVK